MLVSPLGPRGHFWEFSSQQVHSSRRARPLAAQIPTVYSLSMSRRRFASDTHAYRSRFLLYSHRHALLSSRAIQTVSSARGWLYHQGIRESEPSEGVRFSGSTVAAIVYHAPQTLAPLESVRLICFALSVEIFLMQIDRVLQRCSSATLLTRQRSPIIPY